MDVTEDYAILEEVRDNNDDGADDIHPDIPMKGIDFKELLQNWGNDIDNEW